MASTFPTTLDAYTDRTASDPATTRAADISFAFDSCAAIEATVGITNSAVTTSHDYLINHVAVSQTNAIAINAQTSTTYTPVAGDIGKIVTLSNGSAITLTLPQDSDATVAIGRWIDFVQLGAGLVTIAAGTGATVRNPAATLKFIGQYGTVRATKIAANTWLLSPYGSLAAS